jgi:nucleoid-associated protein YgaU
MDLNLKPLVILVETAGSALQFDSAESSSAIAAMFNPNKLAFSRSVQWGNQGAAKRDNPEMQFTGADPATLTLDLIFDTYDTPEPEEAKKNVRTQYIERLLHLTTVEQHGAMHRPPVCRLQWGDQGIFFQGVVQQIQTQYTMFTAAGVPVRASANCTFKQWRSNKSDLQAQDLMSADVAKLWVVKRGETLAGIAALEYGDPRAWLAIAEENGIDDPLALAPGTRLLLPPRRGAWSPMRAV